MNKKKRIKKLEGQVETLRSQMQTMKSNLQIFLSRECGLVSPDLRVYGTYLRINEPTLAEMREQLQLLLDKFNLKVIEHLPKPKYLSLEEKEE